MVLGIISFCISAVFFVMAFFSEFVTHQMSYLMGWLGFGIAGFGFLILEKLDKLSVKNYPYSANKSENMSIKSKVEVKEAYNPSCPNCKIPLRIGLLSS